VIPALWQYGYSDYNDKIHPYRVTETSEGCYFNHIWKSDSEEYPWFDGEGHIGWQWYEF